jgi:hypothetical protein
MDIDQPVEVTVETPEVEGAPVETTQDLRNEPMPEFASNYLPLTQFYNTQDMDQETQMKLQTVWQHFARDAKTPSTVLNKIKQEHFNMTQPNIGDTRLNQMYNYVRILQDIEEAKAMKEAYRK